MDFFRLSVDKLFTCRLQYFYCELAPPFLKPDHDAFLRIFGVLDELLTKIKNVLSENLHLIRALLYFLRIKLNRYYAKFYHLSPETEPHVVAVKLKELLTWEVANRNGLNFFAGKLGISRVTLNKSVKAHFVFNVS